MVNEIMGDYLETWTILRGRIKRITKRRAFLFPDGNDYEEWLNSITNAGIAEALEHRAKWNRDYPFHHFAFLRTRALVRSELRRESDFHASIEASKVKETPQVAAYGYDPIASLLDCDEANWALARMSQDQVEALALRYDADLPVKEIARLMERTPNAVSVLIHRGKERLETLLAGRSASTPPPMNGHRPRPRAHIDDEEEPPPPLLSPIPTNVIPFPLQRRSL